MKYELKTLNFKPTSIKYKKFEHHTSNIKTLNINQTLKFKQKILNFELQTLNQCLLPTKNLELQTPNIKTLNIN